MNVKKSVQRERKQSERMLDVARTCNQSLRMGADSFRTGFPRPWDAHYAQAPLSLMPPIPDVEYPELLEAETH